MKFTHDLSYDAPPDEVLEMLGQPAFRERVCDALHVVRREVEITGSGAGMVVVVDQTQPTRGVPSFAAKFVGEEIRIVQRERWTSPTGADMAIEIPGKPGTFAGSVTLVAAGAGTQETVSGEVSVKIPLISGKLESLVADVLHSALAAEQRVGKAWLAGDR